MFVFKISWSGVTWDDSEWIDNYPFYIYWFNWLSSKHRYWGYQHMWYGGPHKTFGLWYTNISWSTQWTKWKPDD